MSPLIFSCIICGYQIYGSSTSATESWLKEFRASTVSRVCDDNLVLILSVYSSPEGTFVSGVSQHDDINDGAWIAPRDPDVRWDDDDHLVQASDELPVMRQCPENGRHGFVIHDACWRLLQKALDPEDISLERLLKICRSLPFPLRGIGLCWGHDYGGLTHFDNQDHYPWEDRLVEQKNNSKQYQYSRENPYNVPEIPELLTTRLQKLQLLVSKEQVRDCFSKLPWEILEAIAISLPTADALNLRRASKTFLPILASQTFWASRFQVGHDRDFVFEMRNNKEPRDWISLYRITNHAPSPPGLKNRRRVWGLIPMLINMLRLCLSDASRYPRLNSSADGLRWIEVAADVRQQTGSSYCEGFNEGCRLFQRQCASIPSNLSRIAFSIIAASDVEYVTGLRFVAGDDTDVRLGYISEGNELFLKITAVRGFILAMGSRGIRALQVISSDGQVSKWFGCPKDSPVTDRLAGSDCVSALEVGVDVSLIISFL